MLIGAADTGHKGSVQILGDVMWKRTKGYECIYPTRSGLGQDFCFAFTY